jgi:hypothetical protein
MKSSKLPFIITGGIVIAGIVGVSQIPYGPQERTIGQQAVDVATQAKDLYVSHPKPEFGVDYDESDMAIATEATRTIPPIPRGDELDELPPDRWKLWDVDPYSLETTGQDYVYLDTSTGKKIVDATEDGYILKIDPSYEVEMRGEKEKVTLLKEVEGVECEIAIRDYITKIDGEDVIERINNQKYPATLINMPSEIKDFYRFLSFKSDKNNEDYSIKIDYSAPNKCYEANLETEVMNAIVFMDPILDELPSELNIFPEPEQWPYPEDKVEIRKEDDLLAVKHYLHDYELILPASYSVYPNENYSLFVAKNRDCIARIKLEEPDNYRFFRYLEPNEGYNLEWAKDEIEESANRPFTRVKSYRISDAESEIESDLNFASYYFDLNVEYREYGIPSTRRDPDQFFLIQSGPRVLRLDTSDRCDITTTILRSLTTKPYRNTRALPNKDTTLEKAESIINKSLKKGDSYLNDSSAPYSYVKASQNYIAGAILKKDLAVYHDNEIHFGEVSLQRQPIRINEGGDLMSVQLIKGSIYHFSPYLYENFDDKNKYYLESGDIDAYAFIKDSESNIREVEIRDNNETEALEFTIDIDTDTLPMGKNTLCLVVESPIYNLDIVECHLLELVETPLHLRGVDYDYYADADGIYFLLDGVRYYLPEGMPADHKYAGDGNYLITRSHYHHRTMYLVYSTRTGNLLYDHADYNSLWKRKENGYRIYNCSAGNYSKQKASYVDIDSDTEEVKETSLVSDDNFMICNMDDHNMHILERVGDKLYKYKNYSIDQDKIIEERPPFEVDDQRFYNTDEIIRDFTEIIENILQI